MPKTLASLLVVLLLVFAATSARLYARLLGLEEELQASRKPAAPESCPLPHATVPDGASAEKSLALAPSREAMPADPAPLRKNVPAAPPPPAPAVDRTAHAVRAQALLGGVAVQLAGRQLVLRRGLDDPALGLSDSQKRAIEDLRKNSDPQIQTYEDQIRKLDEATDQAIRQLLTADQLAKYDAPFQDPALGSPAPALNSAGQRPGFLGIQGTDRNGGGVEVVQVIPGTTASASGLLPGDVILEVNGQAISNYALLASRITETGEGVPISLKIRRDGTEFYQGLQLGARK